MPRTTKAKSTKTTKPKRKEVPVAPKSKTFVMYKGGRDGYGYSDSVHFYGTAAVKAAKMTASRIKEIAGDLLRGRKPSTTGPVGSAIGSNCASGVKSVLGLSPKAGRIYKVTATYEVEDITEASQAEAKALVDDLEATIKKHTPKPTPKVTKKTATKARAKLVIKEKAAKKTTKSRASTRRHINRYVPPA